MNKMISLFSAALLATVFAASCGKGLEACDKATTKEVCNEPKSFAEGVFCKWNDTASPAVCEKDPVAEKAAAVAKAEAACKAVTEKTKCEAASVDNVSKCEAEAAADANPVCKFTAL